MYWQTKIEDYQSKQVRGMTYYDAAIEVLRAAKRPLSTQEITNEAIKRGLIKPTGKTPESTMGARLYIQLRNNPDLVLQQRLVISESSGVM
jgi:hypothetical protein